MSLTWLISWIWFTLCDAACNDTGNNLTITFFPVLNEIYVYDGDDTSAIVYEHSINPYDYYGQNVSVSTEACLDDGCYTIEFEVWRNTGDSDFDSAGGWLKLQLNGESLTWDDKLITFDDITMQMYFCTSFIDVTSDTGSNNNTNNLTIVIDYDTDIQITQVSYDFDYEESYATDVYVTDIATNNGFYDSNVFSLFNIAEGCYEIILSDANFDYSLLAPTLHGVYKIFFNNKIAAIGGYYTNLDSNIICTDENHVSYCIEEDYCTNKTGLDISGYEAASSSFEYTVVAGNYQHFYNSQVGSYELYCNIGCFGTSSCESLTFGDNYYENLVPSFCGGVFACKKIDTTIDFSYSWFNYYDNSKSVSWYCEAIESCSQMHFVASWIEESAHFDPYTIVYVCLFSSPDRCFCVVYVVCVVSLFLLATTRLLMAASLQYTCTVFVFCFLFFVFCFLFFVVTLYDLTTQICKQHSRCIRYLIYYCLQLGDTCCANFKFI